MIVHNAYLTLGLVAVVAMGDAVWIVTDPRSAADRRRRPMSLTYPRVTAALLPQIASGLLWPWPATTWDPIFVSVGVVGLSIGMITALWARHVMGPRWAPPDAHDVCRQPDLITTAPFSWSRNPIYLSVSLIVVGYAIAVRSYFVFVVAVLVWSLRRSALREEEALERHFGAVYTAYKRRVPRFLFQRGRSGPRLTERRGCDTVPSRADGTHQYVFGSPAGHARALDSEDARQRR